MTTFSAFPQNRVTDTGTLIFSFADPSLFAVLGSELTKDSAADTTKSKVVAASTKVTLTGNTGGGISTSPAISPAINVSNSVAGVYGVWVYLQSNDGSQNGPATAYVDLYLSNTFNVASSFRAASFAGNHLRWNQWNFLPFHINETGATNASGTGSTGWTVSATDPVTTGTANRIALWFGNMSGCTAWVNAVVKDARSRPCVLFGFDQVTTTLNSTVLPLLQARDIQGYLALNSAGAYESNWTLARQWQALGWDCINHGANHISLGTVSDEATIVTEVDGCLAVMEQEGVVDEITRRMFITPQSAQNPYLTEALRDRGYVACRSYKNFCNIGTAYGGADEPLHMGSFDMGNPTSLSRLLGLLNAPRVYGATCWFFAHDVDTTTPATGPTGNALSIYIDDLTAFLDRMVELRAAGAIDILTPSQWYRSLTEPQAA